MWVSKLLQLIGGLEANFISIKDFEAYMKALIQTPLDSNSLAVKEEICAQAAVSDQ